MGPERSLTRTHDTSPAVPVLAALVIGMSATMLLTRPPASAPPVEIVVEAPPTSTDVESVAQQPPEHALERPFDTDWTQTLAAPLLYLAACDYPSASGPEANHTDITWLEDRGVRSLYLRAGRHYSLEWIEAQVGEPMFLSGPHDGQLNFASTSSFGHYNPRFVVAAHHEFERLAATPGFVHVTRSAFATKVQRQLETYLAAHEIALGGAASHNDALTRQYKAQLSRGEVESMFLQEGWRAETGTLEARGADWYEANTALAFWTRRSIDGSAPALQKLMQRVLEVYALPSTLHRA